MSDDEELQQQITAEVHDETRYTPEAREIIEAEWARREER